jgi:predicted MFS family arabinose efflux permease
MPATVASWVATFTSYMFINGLSSTALCLGGLAANVSGRTVEPLITIISAEFAVGVATAALLTSAYALPFALGQPLLGPLGDIYGRPRMLKISLWLLAAALLIASIAPSFELLAVARFCAGLAAGGVVPACMATIGDACPPERRQVVISTFVTMGLLAQIFATSASGLVGEMLVWRYVVFATAVIAILGAAAATAILKTPPTAKTQNFSLSLAASGYRDVFRNPKAVLCYTTVFLEGVALYGIMPYVAEIFRQRGLGGATEAGIVIGAIGVGGLLYVATLSLLLRRFKRHQFMAAGGLLMTVGPLTLAAGTTWIYAAGAFGVTGLGFMLLHNSIQTEVVDLAPAARQSAYSLHAFSFFSGQATGPVLFGIGMVNFGASTSLLISAVILAFTGIVISKVFQRIGAT